jgi:hypothetical protein
MKQNQEKLVADHLTKVGNITRLEADHLYRSGLFD